MILARPGRMISKRRGDGIIVFLRMSRSIPQGVRLPGLRDPWLGLIEIWMRTRVYVLVRRLDVFILVNVGTKFIWRRFSPWHSSGM